MKLNNNENNEIMNNIVKMIIWKYCNKIIIMK